MTEALSARELDVLRAVAAGLSNAEICAALFVSESTVKTHLRHIYAKLGAHGHSHRSLAVALAFQSGVLKVGVSS